MQMRIGGQRVLQLLFALLTAFFATTASAQMYINEIYFDPPGMGDLVFEYIELRGDPNASLTDHYLVFIENETSDTADPGVVEAFFDLGALTAPKLGSNGFLTLRQTASPYSAAAFNPASNNQQNTTGSYGWGIGSSDVGFDDEPGGTFDGILENSGFTAMLIRNNGGMASRPIVPTTDPNSPQIDLDWDDDNELDTDPEITDPNSVIPGAFYLSNWSVIDIIGLNSEASDIDGFLYAPTNFSAGTPLDPNGNPDPHVPEGAEFIDVGFEIEYIGRWGNSTGTGKADWHVSNLTDDGGSGFDGPTDFRQAGEPHGVNTPNQFVETSQGVPYGTKLLDTLGSPNLFIQDGDYDPVYDGEEYVFNGIVDGLDFLAWQRNYGFGGELYATRQHGDGDGSRTVDQGDLALWEANYGTVLPGSFAAALSTVPEPTSVMLLGCAAVLGISRRCLR